VGVRLENYLFRSDVGTYKDINDIIKSGRVKVNGVVQKNNNYKVDAASDFVDIDEKLLSYRKFAYIMMNKPEGYVSSEYDRKCKTVMDIVPDWCLRRKMKPVNLVDKDMSGLVLITDDVGCIHYFNSRKRNNNVVYHVQTNKPVTIEHVEAFASGMRLKHFAGEIATLSKANSYYKSEYAARLTLKESSFNDINKMFRALGVGVLSIELIALGDLILPIELNEGQWRELNNNELLNIRIKNPYF